MLINMVVHGFRFVSLPMNQCIIRDDHRSPPD